MGGRTVQGILMPMCIHLDGYTCQGTPSLMDAPQIYYIKSYQSNRAIPEGAIPEGFVTARVA